MAGGESVMATTDGCDEKKAQKLLRELRAKRNSYNEFVHWLRSCESKIALWIQRGYICSLLDFGEGFGMSRHHFLYVYLFLGLSLFQTRSVVLAESGYLVVHVEDVQRHPVSGVQIGTEGDGGAAFTGDDGKARIQLAKDTKEKSWVSLQILKSPPHKDFVMVSPWDYRAVVPSFENESENFVKVVVVQRRDRTALESGTFLTAATEQINKESVPKTTDKRTPQEDPKASLAAVAKQYGLDPDDLDKAIRSWGEKTTDTYEAGLAALYKRNYPIASAQLKESLQNRETTLATDQKAVADAAFFLGQSLYGEGKYRESARAFQRYLQLRPNDPSALTSMGLSLMQAGDYPGAEPLLRQALTIDVSMWGPDHPLVAAVMGSLGEVLWYRGDYAGAETILRRALVIEEKTLGPEHLLVANILGNLGIVLEDEGDYAHAEPLLRRALAIDEEAPDSDPRLVATSLNNLANLFRVNGDYSDAEPLLRRALAIEEKAAGPDHPDVATSLNNLAELLRAKGDYAGAEPLYHRALAIAERSLGPDHTNLASALSNLAQLLMAKRDFIGAEPLLRQSLDIRERALGPDHPDVAESLNNLGELLYAKGDYAAAEPLFRRALAIVEKSQGPNHPNMAAPLNNLALLLQSEHNYTAAEPLFRQALTVRQKMLGPDHPDTVQIMCNLSALLHDKGDYDGAELLVRQALAIDEKKLGPDHPVTKQIRHVLQTWVSEAPVKKTEK
jgi:tetratricopeptide (TPR) repeat protein